MRLICPNCDAQYEVDDAAIPAAGRDVQCSSCGHGWFQSHPEAEAEREAESALHDAPVAEVPVSDFSVSEPPIAELPVTTLAADPPVAEGPASESLATAPDQPDALPEPPVARPEEPAQTEADAPTALQSRQIDEAVMAVLREEAEREMIARRLDAEPTVETQADLGIDDGAAVGLALPPLTASARHIALLKGKEPDAEPELKRELSRREMLPDIEEINSSLRPGDIAVGDDDDTYEIVQVRHRRSGFRSGFVLMVLLAVAVVALYVMAPRIAEQFPAAKPALDSYVATVDIARAWLDTATRGIVDRLQGLASGDTPPAP